MAGFFQIFGGPDVVTTKVLFWGGILFERIKEMIVQYVVPKTVTTSRVLKVIGNSKKNGADSHTREILQRISRPVLETAPFEMRPNSTTRHVEQPCSDPIDPEHCYLTGFKKRRQQYLLLSA